MINIIADLHTHTLSSGHGIDTIRTLSEFACKKGLQAIAITDHGPGMPGGPDFIYFLSLKRMTLGIDLPIRIIYGVEDDIKNRKGELTLSEEIHLNLEIVLTGIHPFTWIAEQEITVRTDAVINAMQRGIVRAFTHPVGTYSDVHIDPIIKAAVKYNVAMELNATKLSEKKLVIDYLEKCASLGASIVVNSDAHLGEEVGAFGEAKKILQEVSFPNELIINSNKELIASFFRIDW
jgi:putative hydrolase